MLILFDNKTKKYLGAIPEENKDIIDTKNLLIKDVHMNIGEYWAGDYDSGGIRNNYVNEITEQGLKTLCKTKIIEKYDLEKQINNISNALISILKYLNIEEIGNESVDAFLDQVAYISERINTCTTMIDAHGVGRHDSKALNVMNAEENGVHSIDMEKYNELN